MALVITGLMNKAMAYALGTSERTLKVHRAYIMQKMQAMSLAALVRMVALLEMDEPAPAQLWPLLSAG